jgi:hypothetical protein
MAVKSRFCRVCGEPFQAKRFDALTCTGTCRMRKARGADLAYLAALPSYLAEVRRSVHEADLDAIATVRAATRGPATPRAPMIPITSAASPAMPG